MASIRSRTDNGKLFIDFRFKGKRCREQTLLDDTLPNRRTLQKLLDSIEAEITLGTFEYGKYFPESPKANQFQKQTTLHQVNGGTPLFVDFAENWFEEMTIQWRKTHIKGTRNILAKYLLPWFGQKEVGCITKADILAFRSSLAKVRNRRGKGPSASHINPLVSGITLAKGHSIHCY